MASEMIGHELLVIMEKPAKQYVDGKWEDKPNEWLKIRVVQWIKDGKSISIKLGCGKDKFNPANGERRFYAGEFGLKDLDACGPHMAQVRAWMASPPPVPECYKTGAPPPAAGAQTPPESGNGGGGALW